MSGCLASIEDRGLGPRHRGDLSRDCSHAWQSAVEIRAHHATERDRRSASRHVATIGYEIGGPTGNRTRVRGFAVLYVTTPPSGLDAERANAGFCAAGQPGDRVCGLK
ncbi:hypothetical protein SPHINGOT1_260236 [Sphingomonas sp. T1]|nr:hypothetical protein SPHINGOT1_260236 [Sphingomonas sp. T1]